MTSFREFLTEDSKRLQLTPDQLLAAHIEHRKVGIPLPDRDDLYKSGETIRYSKPDGGHVLHDRQKARIEHFNSDYVHHRSDGPAVINGSGLHAWYEHGQKYAEYKTGDEWGKTHRWLVGNHTTGQKYYVPSTDAEFDEGLKALGFPPHTTKHVTEETANNPVAPMLIAKEHPFDPGKHLDFHMAAADSEQWHIIPDVPMKQGTVTRHHQQIAHFLKSGPSIYEGHYNDDMPYNHPSVPKHIHDLVEEDIKNHGPVRHVIHLYDTQDGATVLVHHERDQPSWSRGTTTRHFHDNIKPGHI